MIIEYKEITSLEQVDFDSLFYQSLSRLDANYLWGRDNLTPEQKRDIYYNRLLDATLDKSHLKKDGDRFLMYKILVDGVERELSAGFVSGTTYIPYWHLTAPDPTGSRNWLYLPETREARKAFFYERVIYSMAIRTFKGSELYNIIKSRSTTGNFQILDERPTIEGDNPQNLVTLTIST